MLNFAKMVLNTLRQPRLGLVVVDLNLASKALPTTPRTLTFHHKTSNFFL